MRVIYKYPLKVTDVQTIEMPREHRIYAVQVQDGVPCIWAEVDTDTPRESVTVLIVGTGHVLGDDIADDNSYYAGTFILHNDRFVGHVFIADTPGDAHA